MNPQKFYYIDGDRIVNGYVYQYNEKIKAFIFDPRRLVDEKHGEWKYVKFSSLVPLEDWIESQKRGLQLRLNNTK